MDVEVDSLDLVGSEAVQDPSHPLTQEQLVGACSLLLFGGHETTTSLLSSGALHLCQRPEAVDRLAKDGRAIESAVEELLRFDGPSKILVRRVRCDCEWHGHRFTEGQAVFCATMAANRDPEVFEDPEVFLMDRSPNRHVGFGFGRHFCLGAQLARLEAQVILPLIFDRFPGIHLECEVDELEYHPTIVGRTLRHLPVSLC